MASRKAYKYPVVKERPSALSSIERPNGAAFTFQGRALRLRHRSLMCHPCRLCVPWSCRVAGSRLRRNLWKTGPVEIQYRKTIQALLLLFARSFAFSGIKSQ